MPPKSHKIEPKILLPVKVKPAVKQVLRRIAAENGERPSPHAEKVLEAYTRGLWHCQSCNIPHKASEACPNA